MSKLLRSSSVSDSQFWNIELISLSGEECEGVIVEFDTNFAMFSRKKYVEYAIFRVEKALHSTIGNHLHCCRGQQVKRYGFIQCAFRVSVVPLQHVLLAIRNTMSVADRAKYANILKIILKQHFK